MEDSAVTRAAEILLGCWREGRVIEALPAECRPDGPAEGYAVQARLAALAGEPVAGWKIAATNPAGQRHIGVGGPLAGRLLAGRIERSPASVALGANRMRVAEAEFAFVLAADLPARPGGYPRAALLERIAALCPAIELPDSRFADFVTAGEAQLIADDACAHLFVLGAEAGSAWRDLDLAAQRVTVGLNGAPLLTGCGADVLGGPLEALAWLAEANAARGEPLRAGDVITTGVCGRPVPIAAGDRVVADFGPLGRAEVRIR